MKKIDKEKNKKIIFAVAGILAIAGGLYLLNLKNNNDGFDNKKPMFGVGSYEDYIAKRSKWHKKSDEKSLGQLMKDNGNDQVKSFDIACHKGWNNLLKSDIESATNGFNQAWLVDNDNFNVYWGYGDVYMEQDDYEKAIEMLENSLKLYKSEDSFSPEDITLLKIDAVSAYVNQSFKYRYENNPEKSVEYADKANALLDEVAGSLDSVPDSKPMVFNLKGAIELLKGDVMGAIKDLDEAFKLKPELKENNLITQKIIGELMKISEK